MLGFEDIDSKLITVRCETGNLQAQIPSSGAQSPSAPLGNPLQGGRGLKGTLRRGLLHACEAEWAPPRRFEANADEGQRLQTG